MKKSAKKIVSIATAIVFVTFSSVSYGKDSTDCQGQAALLYKLDAKELLHKLDANEQNILFIFMRDYEFLRMLSASCQEQQPIALSDLKVKLNSYFSEQFLTELDALKQKSPDTSEKLLEVLNVWLYPRTGKRTEPRHPRSPSFLLRWQWLVEGDFYDFCKVITTSDYYESASLSPTTSILNAIKNTEMLFGWMRERIQNVFFDNLKQDPIKTNTLLKEFYDVFEGVTIDNYPATVNLINLINAFLSDLNELRTSIKEDMTDDQIMKFIRLVFADALINYEKFIDQNKDVLEKIEQLANNAVEIDITKKKCVQFKGKDFCI